MCGAKHPSRSSAAAERIFPVVQPAAADDPHGPATDPQRRRLGRPASKRSAAPSPPRVGQICNAALDRSIIAYNENSDAEERERCREETETLAILTGLEIDSAKSGIRPDLDEYLTHKTVKRSDFLKYKMLVEEMETRRAWYEPTHAAKVKAFFKKVDWGRWTPM